MVNQLDLPETISVHKRAIRENRFLHQVYVDFYQKIMASPVPTGLQVELGTGAGFLKEFLPDLITSDIVPGHGIDQVFSAIDLPFNNNSVAAFYMLNVFHHIKDPEKSLKEMYRCLKPWGKIIMVEPYNSWFGRFFYKYFHYEGFDPKAGWQIPGEGRLSDANNAAPWIIFVRDRALFEQKFSHLKIRSLSPHTPLAYLVSGGLNRDSFLPFTWYPVIKFVQKILNPFRRVMAMFVTIELEKCASADIFAVEEQSEA